jgi:hypothetical protein
MKSLVFTVNQGSAGGLADRLIGLASAHLISAYLGTRFYIDFQKPFRFFSTFSPHLRSDYEWSKTLELSFTRVARLSLIDVNFNAQVLTELRSLVLEPSIVVYLEINQLKLSVLNQVFPGIVTPGVSTREILNKFGRVFLHTNLECFSTTDIELFRQVQHRRTIGLAVRVGGNTSGWADSFFRLPTIDSILFELGKHQRNFDQIYLSSDSEEFKLGLNSIIKTQYEVITHSSAPLHLDRSPIDENDSINSVIFDHHALRQCAAGVLTAGGRFGLTAAWLSGASEFHLLEEADREPL